MKDFIVELLDEAGDFFEDIWEHLSSPKVKRELNLREVSLNGVITKVRPAYLFAERIDNLMRMFFGLSVLLSGLTATLVGFASLSSLVEALIFTLGGRILMVIIGLSYLIVAIWKLMHLPSAR